MKKNRTARIWLGGAIALSTLGILSCSQQEAGNTITANEKKDTSKQAMIDRGAYLVTIGSCSDCHSPKNFTNMGPVVDSTRYLSGHPATSKLPPIDVNMLKPGGWGLMALDATCFVGPWGISFAANLTPDSATGLGAWSEEVFMKTLQTGKHLGQPAGRSILPPMPWYFLNHMTEVDFKSVYAYLRSIPAISNRVPEPVSPPDMQKMAAK